VDKKTGQWLEQSDYDMNTAEYMFTGGRYFYAVFMCHLSIEKALKGLYYEKLKKVPPRTHNLISLANELEIKLPEEEGKFVVKINSASIVTRYPEDLEELKKQYTKDVVKDMLEKAKKVIKWIKAQL
jgi:HEPN domain-containing protein